MTAKMFVAFCIVLTLLPYFAEALRANDPPTKHKQFQEINYDIDDESDETEASRSSLFQADISDEDLGYFYDFCLMLPKLEKIGRIPKNRITQSTCQKLYIILDPLFRKTSETKSYKWF